MILLAVSFRAMVKFSWKGTLSRRLDVGYKSGVNT